MKRLVDWIAGAVSGVIAYRLWAKRQSPAAATVPAAVPEEPDDRAEELRAKLAETRATEEPAPEAEPTAEQPAEHPGESLEDRRRRVHDEGRAAIDRMNDI